MSKVQRFWCDEARNIRCVREDDFDALEAEAKALREEVAALRARGLTVSERLVQGMAKFAREIICGALDGGSFDGADIQESAERHGLIAKQVMNEPCRGPEEYCACAWSTSFPTECYRITAELRALLSEQEGGNDVSNHQ
ncbi:hypothetical protein MTX71_07940 [Pseudomonas aeruginosa]|uniref:hypothetical protein n=1 Tax=Pseudomonas aeruginosa TaxID=287 RepID=UPI002166CF90|nr:hypothetical protein [Pseudomonas aeruginosa]UVW76827.1 hypothetical protein MTX71_07940 [Pseudomonas aeruginosa]